MHLFFSWWNIFLLEHFYSENKIKFSWNFFHSHLRFYLALEFMFRSRRLTFFIVAYLLILLSILVDNAIFKRFWYFFFSVMFCCTFSGLKLTFFQLDAYYFSCKAFILLTLNKWPLAWKHWSLVILRKSCNFQLLRHTFADIGLPVNSLGNRYKNRAHTKATLHFRRSLPSKRRSPLGGLWRRALSTFYM